MHHIRGPLVAAPSAGGRRRRRWRGRRQGRRHGGRRRQLAANVGCFIVEWPSRRGVLGGDVRPAQCPARAAAEFVAVEVVGRPLAQAGSPTLRSQGRARPCTRTAGRRTLRKPAAPVAEAAREHHAAPDLATAQAVAAEGRRLGAAVPRDSRVTRVEP